MVITMDFHLINEKNLPKVANLWDYCFEKKDTFFFKWYFNEYCLKQNEILGGFSKQAYLSTMLHLNPYKINLRGMEASTTYLVGIATDPVSRGRRVLKELFEIAFAILRAQGKFFVILMPEHAGVYLPYQFSFTYYKHRYELPLNELNFGNVDESVELFRLEKPTDFTVFSKLYESFMSKYNGFVIRDDRFWTNFFSVFLHEDGEILLAFRGNIPVGYMFYQRINKNFRINELIYSEPDVKNSFLRYTRQHLAQCDKLEWLAEIDDLTYLHFPKQVNSGSLNPFVMARVIDAQRALEALPLTDCHKEGSLILLVTDDLIKANNTLVKLDIGEKNIKIENVFELPDVEMDIGAFTQLYFGQFSLDELAAEGLITVNSNDAGTLLSSIFPKCKNYINEYY